jgi:ligand-binding sensor domain-containing protein
MVKLGLTAILVCLSALTLGLGKATGQKFNSVAGHRVLTRFKAADIGSRGDWVSAIFEDRFNSKYWIITPFEIIALDQSRQRWDISSYGDLGRFSFDSLVMAQSSNGGLWLGWRDRMISPEDNIFRFDSGRWRRATDYEIGIPVGSLGHLPLETILTNKDGSLWFVYRGYIVHFDGSTWSPPLQLPKACSAERLVLDSGTANADGTLWLGGNCIVIYKASQQTFHQMAVPSVIEGNVAWMFEDSRNRNWIADRYGHVAIYSVQTDKWATYNILDIVASGSSTGEDEPSGKFVLTNAAYDDAAGRVYLGTSEGLIVFEGQPEKWTVYTEKNSALPSRNVTSIIRDSRGHLWVGTSKGIVILAN